MVSHRLAVDRQLEVVHACSMPATTVERHCEGIAKGSESSRKGSERSTKGGERSLNTNRAFFFI